MIKLAWEKPNSVKDIEAWVQTSINLEFSTLATRDLSSGQRTPLYRWLDGVENAHEEVALAAAEPAAELVAEQPDFAKLAGAQLGGGRAGK